MNPLHQAYFVLGLQLGVSFDVIKARYRRMAEAWHPDRAPNQEKQDYYTEELKKINHAYDVLKTHFDGPTHATTGSCQCNAPADLEYSDRTQTGPNSEYHREFTESSTSQKPQGEGNYSSERLRRQLSMGIAAAFLMVFLCACGAYALRGIVRHWFPPAENHTPTDTKPQSPDRPDQTQTPLIDPAEVQRQQQRQQQRERDQKKREEAIYFAKLEVDRHLKAIEHCRNNILEIETRLFAPTIALPERLKYEQMRALRQQVLETEQTSLESAQANLAVLQDNIQSTQSIDRLLPAGPFAPPLSPPTSVPTQLQPEPSLYEQVAPKLE